MLSGTTKIAGLLNERQKRSVASPLGGEVGNSRQAHVSCECHPETVVKGSGLGLMDSRLEMLHLSLAARGEQGQSWQKPNCEFWS